MKSHSPAPSSLALLQVHRTSQANEQFGNEKGLLVVRPGRSIMPFFSVPEGAYALVTRFGKDYDHRSGSCVWPAGFHWGAPWVKVMNLVSKQSVVFNTPVKGCKTQDNVTVQINLAIVFRIRGDETCEPSRAPSRAPSRRTLACRRPRSRSPRVRPVACLPAAQHASAWPTARLRRRL